MATGNDDSRRKKKTESTMCDKHRQFAVDQYCEQCEQVGCRKCMELLHKDHCRRPIQDAIQDIEYRLAYNLDNSTYTWLPLLEGKRLVLLEKSTVQENSTLSTISEDKSPREKIDPSKGKLRENSAAKERTESKRRNISSARGKKEIENATFKDVNDMKKKMREDENYRPTASELNRAIDRKADDMMNVIDNYRTRLKKYVHLLYNGKEEMKVNTLVELNEDIPVLKTLLSRCSQANESGSPLDIIRANKDLEQCIRRLENNYSKTSDEPHYFRNGNWNVDALEYMVGSIEEIQRPCYYPNQVVSMRVKAVYTFGEEDVRLCAISEEQAWVSDNGDTMHSIMHCNGYSKQDINFDFCVQCFAKSPSGEIYVIDYTAKWIKKIQSNGRVKDLFKTAPMYPVAMCVTSDNDLLIAMTDIPIDVDSETRQSFISMRTVHGQEIRKFENNPNDAAKVFIFLRSVDTNITGEMIVIDMVGHTQGQVYVLSDEGQLKHSYHGSSKLEVEFNPVQTCCDDMGRILVTDVNNDVIHLLSKDAELLQLLFLEDDIIYNPLSISLVRNTLWIGCKNGRVILGEYESLGHVLVLRSVSEVSIEDN